MSKTASKPSSINDSARCQHRTVTGRRCRLAVVHPSSGLCFRHAFLRSKLGEEADLRTALAGDLPDFTSAEQINAFLSKLILLLSENRVSPRRAAVIAYVGSLLLRSLPLVQWERSGGADDSDSPKVIVDFGDLPRPNRNPLPAKAEAPTEPALVIEPDPTRKPS